MKIQILVLLAVLVVVAAFVRVTSNSNGATQVEAPVERKLFRYSSREKAGYTVNGIQPGDDLQQLLAELPPEVRVEEVPMPHPRPSLQLSAPGQQALKITSKQAGGREVVKGIWCMGPGPGYSIELDGKPILHGGSSYSDFTQRLGDAVHSDGADTGHGSKLRVEFTSAGLFVASLKLVD